jgi:RNA polymerase sigma-70 factor (ECF subfamily)
VGAERIPLTCRWKFAILTQNWFFAVVYRNLACLGGFNEKADSLFEHRYRMPVATETQQNAWLRDPDVQRMLRVQAGDDGAFAELVDAYQNRLISLFTLLLRESSSAEDLAQDVFLRVYRARERYQPTAKFATWIFRIANNLANNKRRQVSRKKEINLAANSESQGARPEEGLAVERSSLMPQRVFDKQEIRGLVQQALETLSDRQKQALFLNKFQHMSYTDIAATMDLSLQAVKSLLTRARENLRIKLEQFVA